MRLRENNPKKGHEVTGLIELGNDREGVYRAWTPPDMTGQGGSLITTRSS